MGDLAPDGTPYSAQERESFDQALSFLTRDVLAKPPDRIGIDTMTRWHGQMASGVPRMLPGTLRTSQRTGFGNYPACPPHEVLASLQALFRELNGKLDRLDHHVAQQGMDTEALRFLIMESAYLHAKLVAIHPFMDGNGRLSRLVQSWMLARFTVVAPQFDDHDEYIAAINVFHDHADIGPLAELTGREVNRMTNEAEK